MTTRKHPLISITLDPSVRSLLELIGSTEPLAPGRRLRIMLELMKTPAVREALLEEAARRGWIGKP